MTNTNLQWIETNKQTNKINKNNETILYETIYDTKKKNIKKTWNSNQIFSELAINNNT